MRDVPDRPSEPPARTVPLRVLLVEDDESHVELICRSFGQPGRSASVTVASSLEQARALLVSSRPDIILADWRLPDGRGTELLSGQPDPALPVVLMTAHGDEQTAVEAMRAGAIDYVVKSGAAFADIPRTVERALRESLAAVERERMEHTLREREELFSSVVERAQDITVVVGHDRRIRYISPSVEHASGFPPDGFTGRPVEELAIEADRPALRERVERALSTPGEPQDCTLRVSHRGGEERVAEAVAAAHVTATGELRVVVNARDVTDRVRAERERQQLERQLRLSQRLDAIGQLASGIAHDFNNILTVIGGYAELLALAPRDPEVHDGLAEILRAHASAAALTRQLLAFAGRQTLQVSEVDLNDVVRGLKRMLDRVLGERITIALELEPELPAVLADPGQMDQVVINLLVNARDAMPSGGRILIATAVGTPPPVRTVSTAPFESDRFVRLRVQDTGTGIPADVLPRIFDPFFTTKGRGHGTGLGLSTIAGIVKQSGGDLAVHSEVGVGTAFDIYLPARDREVKAERAAGDFMVEQRGTETVLLAEDNLSVRALVRQQLERLGYTVAEASDGRHAEAIARTRPGPIDVLVTDVVMPGVNGPDLAERVRIHRPQIKVLFMSGYADTASPVDTQPAGTAAFLQKPFGADHLATTLRELLGRGQPAAASGPREPGLP